MTSEHRSSRSHWPKLYDDFRKKLVAAREAAGFSQRQAAALLGRSQSFVAKSENGERRVDVVELQAFARIYSQEVQAFIHGGRLDLGSKIPNKRRKS